MVVSGLIIKFPYWLCWHLLRVFKQLNGMVFYVESEHDYYVIENILPHISYPYIIVANSQSTANKLKLQGLQVKVWPVFPKIIFMTRHAFHRFPIKAVKKIGIKHGTYHFKKMIHPKKYNAFDLYIFTTESEAKMVAEKGVKCGIVGGQPKLDTLFSQDTLKNSRKIKQQPGFDANKKTLLFTTTWDKSGLSAIDKWIDKLSELTAMYNILVSMHPMMSKDYIDKVKSIPGISIADSDNLPAYMVAADFLIGDTSSVMGEFCALNKPIITFVVKQSGRLTPEIKEMIKDISVQIANIDELGQAVEKYIRQPDLKQTQRQKWSEVFYGDTERPHGNRVAEIVDSFIKKHSS